MSPAVVPNGETARKLEVDLFEEPDPLEDEVLTELEEGLMAEQPNGAGERRDVLMPAGWGRFRRRLRRAFRRVGDSVRNFLRKHKDHLIPIILRAV